MKEFLKKIGRLILCLPVICAALIIVSIADSNHFFGELPGDEVYNALELSEKNSGCKKVVLGDSVAKQLFVPGKSYNNEYYGLTTNRAVGLAGQYLLLKNYLQNNPQTEEVIIMLLPSSVQQDFNDKLTYSYFVLPFFQYYKYFMTDESIKTIENNYGRFCSDGMIFLMSNSAMLRNLYQSYIMDVSDQKSSEAWRSYLVKIENMCKENKVKLRWYCSPMADSDESREKLNALYENCGKDEKKLFSETYFDSIKYYDKKNMRDGIHFYDSYLEKSKDKIIADIIGM